MSFSRWEKAKMIALFSKYLKDNPKIMDEDEPESESPYRSNAK